MAIAGGRGSFGARGLGAQGLPEAVLEPDRSLTANFGQSTEPPK